MAAINIRQKVSWIPNHNTCKYILTFYVNFCLNHRSSETETAVEE